MEGLEPDRKLLSTVPLDLPAKSCEEIWQVTGDEMMVQDLQRRRSSHDSTCTGNTMFEAEGFYKTRDRFTGLVRKASTVLETCRRGIGNSPRTLLEDAHILEK